MTNLKVQFASLSFGASVDQQTGNLSVFDIIEEIRTPQLPVQLQSLVIALAFEKQNLNEVAGKIMIHFLTPDGKQQMVGTGDMRIPIDQKRMKAVFRFGGFPLATTGSHRFVVSCLDPKGNKIAESILNFEVVQISQANPGGTPPAERPPLAH